MKIGDQSTTLCAPRHSLGSEMSDEERADHEKLFHLQEVRSGDSTHVTSTDRQNFHDCANGQGNSDEAGPA